MNAEKFGAFVASCRKEQHMTQLELAQKLQVTDKAVSRWERGKGFPDISLLVPLSEALDISVLELMHSEKMEKREERFTSEDVKGMMVKAAEMQEKCNRDNHIITWIATPVIVLITLLTVLSGRASLIPALWLGCTAALSIIGICLFALGRQDPAGRKTGGILMLSGTGGTLLLSLLMGGDVRILLGGLFVYLCVAVAAAIR